MDGEVSFLEKNALGGRVREVGLGGQGGCERRIEVFEKINKNNQGGGGQCGCDRAGMRIHDLRVRKTCSLIH